MGILETFPAPANGLSPNLGTAARLADDHGPAATLSRFLAQFDREAIATTVEVLIALLDAAEAPSDPDEPAFAAAMSDGGPGEVDDGEDDDPAGVADEDGANTYVQPSIRDELAEEELALLSPDFGIDQTREPAEFAPDADARLMAPHRDRIRQTACTPIGWREWSRGPLLTRYELYMSDAAFRAGIHATMAAHGIDPLPE